MKKIGLVDFYISEWHANNYPVWIREINAELGTDFEVAYAWAEEDVSPVDGVTTDEWCAKMQVTRCATLAELCEKSDVILVLAPSNPEKHLPYAKEVLPYGKRTYIDKTFAPDLETAKEIFRIASEHGTPFFSTSALRYAEELGKHLGDTSFLLTGGGRSLDEYSIHLVEMAVVLFGAPATRVKAERQGERFVFFLETEGGEAATVVFSRAMPFGIEGEDKEGKSRYHAAKSPFFMNLMRAILRFYESGELPFDGKETLEVMRIRDGVLKAAEHCGEWIDL